MRGLFEKLLAGSDLTEGEARGLVDELVDPATDPVLARSVLTALRIKGGDGRRAARLCAPTP